MEEPASVILSAPPCLIQTDSESGVETSEGLKYEQLYHTTLINSNTSVQIEPVFGSEDQKFSELYNGRQRKSDGSDEAVEGRSRLSGLMRNLYTLLNVKWVLNRYPACAKRAVRNCSRSRGFNAQTRRNRLYLELKRVALFIKFIQL